MSDSPDRARISFGALRQRLRLGLVDLRGLLLGPAAPVPGPKRKATENTNTQAHKHTHTTTHKHTHINAHIYIYICNV